MQTGWTLVDPYERVVNANLWVKTLIFGPSTPWINGYTLCKLGKLWTSVDFFLSRDIHIDQQLK